MSAQLIFHWWKYDRNYSIGAYIPEVKLNNLQHLKKFSITEDFIRNKIGVELRALKRPDEDIVEMCCAAVADLKEKTNLNISDVDCLIVCTQNPQSGGLPHNSALVQSALGAPKECACFDISLGCSGYVYGLSIIMSFMKYNGLETGLLFTADPYSKILDPNDKNTSLLFGDAASVTLISPDYKWSVGKFCFGTDGNEWSALCIDEDVGKLYMDGRRVFSFSAKVVRKI